MHIPRHRFTVVRKFFSLASLSTLYISLYTDIYFFFYFFFFYSPRAFYASSRVRTHVHGRRNYWKNFFSLNFYFTFFFLSFKKKFFPVLMRILRTHIYIYVCACDKMIAHHVYIYIWVLFLFFFCLHGMSNTTRESVCMGEGETDAFSRSARASPMWKARADLFFNEISRS